LKNSLIILFTFCLTSNVAYSQQFNKTHFPGDTIANKGSWVLSMLPLDNDTIMVGVEFIKKTATSSNTAIRIQKLLGKSIVFEKEFEEPTKWVTYSKSKIIKINDTNYLNICPIIWYTGINADTPHVTTRLIFVNPKRNLDTILITEFYSSAINNLTGYYNGIYFDNKLYLSGQNSNPYNDKYSEIAMMCIDLQGNKIWETFFGTFNKYDGCSDIAISNNNKIIISAKLARVKNNMGDIIDEKNGIYILDTIGNILFQKNMWKSTHTYISNIRNSNDGYFYYGNRQDTIIGAFGSNDGIATIAKIDSLGIVVWQKYFVDNPNIDVNIYNFESLPNSDVMLTGSIGYDQEGWACLLNKNGNTKWEHTYKSFDSSVFNIIAASMQASNGDFVLAGTAIDSATKKQASWILRVDSNGCLVPSNCAPLSTQQIELDIAFDIIAYPNPTNAILQIESSNGRSLHGALELYNNMGQQVFKTTLLSNANTIKMSNFAIGIYTIRYFDTEVKKWFIKRVIKN
jgi:Secretion system C-terminal sorting domain